MVHRLKTRLHQIVAGPRSRFQLGINDNGRAQFKIKQAWFSMISYGKNYIFYFSDLHHSCNLCQL
jgi:hypothetical protein